MKFSFRRPQPSDYELLHTWLNSPHVKEWWTGDTSLNAVKTDFNEKLAGDTVYPYIVELDGKPIGYIQRYDANKAGEGWWPDEPEGTWGIDQFIGVETLLDQGIGAALIREFTAKMFKGGEATRIIADPRPDNARAIRAYEKAGFRAVKEITTPDGKALLMELLKKPEGRNT
ncbi:MAG: GNAT family N-acetyltransferase [Bdellovibrionia bacterium]